jgi:complex iron-sulfur molybdoenzyme family reductase subunit gamma
VEKLTAEGFGTISSVDVEKQDGSGKGEWKGGTWKAVISIPRAQERFSFQRGETMPVAFAAWDGGRKERGGEKAISTWYFLSLERAVGPFAYINPLLVVAGVAIVQVLALRLLRRKAKQDGQTNR